jgi:hypothetical protein
VLEPWGPDEGTSGPFVGRVIEIPKRLMASPPLTESKSSSESAGGFSWAELIPISIFVGSVLIPSCGKAAAISAANVHTMGDQPGLP